MAVGEITDHDWNRGVKLIEGDTAANNPPSSATDGIDLNELFANLRPTQGSVQVKSTAGSGTMTVTLTAWGYSTQISEWVPIASLNSGNAIEETDTDTIQHTETVEPLTHFTRFYLEINAIAGTSTAIDAWIVIGKET